MKIPPTINTSNKPSNFLKWEDRPQDIVEKINSVFNKLKVNDRSLWGVYIMEGMNTICLP